MANVYFDIQVNSQDSGRIEFKLFDEVVPRTAKNFRELATGERGFGYQGSSFHRIIPGSMIEGGDITRGDGCGGRSIYGDKFDDENFHLKHDRDGIVSMANTGQNTNSSRFIITTAITYWLDGKHVVFGEVIKGADVVKAIEVLGSQNGTPKAKVTIARCGIT